MGVPEFTVDVFQNEYLPAGGSEVNASVTVTSAGFTADRPATVAGAAEIIIVECSGSMAKPMAKMIQAREAAAAAINFIGDGVAFVVVGGRYRARPVYPEDGGLAVADERTRETDKGSLAGLKHKAGGRLSLLKLDPIQHEQLTAEVLRAALACVLPGGPEGGAKLLGCEFTERSLRFGLERSYRAQAQLAPDRNRRIELVDAANDVRPRTWS